MLNVEYVRLSRDNFTVDSLVGFRRYQHVTQCWRRKGGNYVLTPVEYTEDWDLKELREMAEKILITVDGGGLAYGAIAGGKTVGFALLDGVLFGSSNQYMDLAEFYVSDGFRNRGIGRRLFGLACEGAKKSGATKLYISAHSAKDSIAAYVSYGCVSAEEINVGLAEKEPCDLQLEFKL